MPLEVVCPSCNARLNVGEELVGQEIQCGGCRNVMVVARPPAPPPSSKRGRPRCPSCGDPVDPDDGECRACGAILDADARPRRSRRRDNDDYGDRPRRREYDEDDGRGWEDEENEWGRGRRRDLEPHRGGTVMGLGLTGLIMTPVGWLCCNLLCLVALVMCIAAWVMGAQDLRAMRAGTMDPEGRGNTNAGYVCGIIGTILNALTIVIGGIVLVVFIAASAAKR